MGQDEIFRLLLLVLLMSNEASTDGSTYGSLNEIIIIGLILSLSNEKASDDQTLTTFPR